MHGLEHSKWSVDYLKLLRTQTTMSSMSSFDDSYQVMRLIALQMVLSSIHIGMQVEAEAEAEAEDEHS